MAKALNLVGGLSAEIERVALKVERWKGYCEEMPDLAAGMQPGIAMMNAELANAREALNSGEIVPMMAAIETLRGYDSND